MKYLKRYWVIVIVICIASIFAAVNVSLAATANGSLNLSATVAGACSVGASSIGQLCTSPPHCINPRA